MKIKELRVSKYSTDKCQTIVIITEDNRTVEVDLFSPTSEFQPNSVRVKVHPYEWGHKLPNTTAFGHPYED